VAYLGPDRYARMHERALRRNLRRATEEPDANVVVLHGIMGAELTATDRKGGNSAVWVRPLRLLAGAIARLQLDPDGLQESDLDWTVRPSAILKKHYGELILSLSENYRVLPFYYDWRKDIARAGDALNTAITSSFTGDKPIHLVAHSAMRGLVCETAPRDGKPAYGLLDDWLGDSGDGASLDRDAALAELARRYVAAHPPAGPEDLAAWSGLGIPDARRAFAAIEGELDEVRVLDRAAWVARGRAKPEGTRTVRLLPTFDGLLLAHRDRALTVREEHSRDVLPGGGVVRPTLLVDGLVEGNWRLDRGRPAVSPFAGLAAEVAEAVAVEADDVVRHRST